MNQHQVRKHEEEEEVMEIDSIVDFVPFDEWDIQLEEDVDLKRSKHPFRLGLELETGRLLRNNLFEVHAVQKEPLFTCMNKNGEKLWHFELDGIDIEIVTAPFSNNEESKLKESIKTAKVSFAILKELVNTEGAKYTLKNWYDKLKENGLILREEELFKKLENEIISWKNGTQKWEGFVQPHATIQLSLEHVIELSFEIFKNVSTIISTFEASLPFKTRESFEEYFKCETMAAKKALLKTFRNKIDGLMFLQAETLMNISLPSYYNKTNVESTRSIYNDYLNFHQVCPKMFLHIMSRRPYSDMLNQLEETERIGYSKAFKERMKNNLLFMNFDLFVNYCNTRTIDLNSIEFNQIGVPQCFERCTYADEYYEGQLETPTDLRSIFKEDCFNEDDVDQIAIDNLLKNGVLPTSILRSLKKEAIESLNLDKVLKFMNYDDVVDSVENPKWRPIIKIENKQLLVVENNEENDEICKHDFISPFLASSNNGKGISKRNCDSMGSYQNSPEELKCADFGEAIFEIRAISYAQHEELGNRISRNGEIMSNLFLSEIEYLESDFLSLFKLIGKI